MKKLETMSERVLAGQIRSQEKKGTKADENYLKKLKKELQRRKNSEKN